MPSPLETYKGQQGKDGYGESGQSNYEPLNLGEGVPCVLNDHWKLDSSSLTHYYSGQKGERGWIPLGLSFLW